jgi:hypothetical protein
LRSLVTAENAKVEIIIVVVVVLFLLVVLILVGGGVRLWDLGAVLVPVVEVAGVPLRVPLPARERVPCWGLDGERGVASQRGRKQGAPPAGLLDPFGPIARHGRHRHGPAL